MAVLVAATAIWIRALHVTLWILPLYVLLLSFLSLGLAWIVAGLQVYLRDTAQVLTVVLTAWFWLTPIFLSESHFENKLDLALWGNPVTYVVRGYRYAILGGRIPPLLDLLTLAAFSLTLFFAGALFFRYA